MEVIPDAVVAAVVVVVAGSNAVRVGVPVGFVVMGFAVGLCEGIAVVGTSSGLAVGIFVSSGGVGAGVTGLAVVGIPVVGVGLHSAPTWHVCSEQHSQSVGYSLSS